MHAVHTYVLLIKETSPAPDKSRRSVPPQWDVFNRSAVHVTPLPV